MSSVEANSTKGRARSCLCRWNSGWINLYNFLFLSWRSVCSHYFNPDSLQQQPGEQRQTCAFHGFWQKNLWLSQCGFPWICEMLVMLPELCAYPAMIWGFVLVRKFQQSCPWCPLKGNQVVSLGFLSPQCLRFLNFEFLKLIFVIFFNEDP